MLQSIAFRDSTDNPLGDQELYRKYLEYRVRVEQEQLVTHRSLFPRQTEWD